VFSNELQEVPDYPAGEIVEVKNYSGRSYGLGFYNPHSLIAVRMLETDTVFDGKKLEGRIRMALEYRMKIGRDTGSMRLVYGESDFLPGLIIDKFGDYFSLQILSAGMENFIHEIVNSIKKIFPDVKAIVEKNDSHWRKIENLELRESVLFGDLPDEIEFKENNIKYKISLLSGQKTGYYLDQSDNRKFTGSISKGLSVLDCYCNQGGFALNAALGGAVEVLGIDASEDAILKAKANAELNKLTNIKFEKADVPEFLEKQISENIKWDMIILDPPAFTKSKKNVSTAKAGYAKINRLAMKSLNEGGFLVSSSCSGHITEDTFYDIIANEAGKLNQHLRLVFRGGQASDHPILSAMPETKYLKFFVFQVL